MVVITGASKGIGKAIAEKFAKKGFDLAICSRSLKDLEKVKVAIETYYKVKVFIQSADLAIKEEVKIFSDFVKRIEKPIDVLINNAGYFIPGAIHNEKEGVLESQIETNLYSAYYLTRHLIGDMIKRKKGHIFNIASIASFVAYKNGGSYAVSKHAMHGFSKCLREEMKEFGIRVTSILPGATFTSSWEGVDLPEDRFSKPEDIAEIVWASYKISSRSVVEDVIIRPQLGDL